VVGFTQNISHDTDVGLRPSMDLLIRRKLEIGRSYKYEPQTMCRNLLSAPSVVEPPLFASIHARDRQHVWLVEQANWFVVLVFHYLDD
jgi:hypothetical protein